MILILHLPDFEISVLDPGNSIEVFGKLSIDFLALWTKCQITSLQSQDFGLRIQPRDPSIVLLSAENIHVLSDGELSLKGSITV